jgi:hypothetical protein
MKKNKKAAEVTPTPEVTPAPAAKSEKTEAKYFAAKDVAALLHMTAKNLRKHLRNLSIEKNAELGRYRFTPKQCEMICNKIEAQIAEHSKKAPAAETPAEA